MKTKEQLNTQIDQTIYPNTQGLIDAQKENSLLKEMVDSSVNKMTDAPLDDKYYGLKNQQVVDLELENYQKSEDTSLNTTNKTVIGGINEVYTSTLKYAKATHCTSAALTDFIRDSWTITFNENGLLSFNGEPVTSSSLIFVKDETTFPMYEYNGIFEVLNTGSSTEQAVIRYVGSSFFVLVSDLMGANAGTYITTSNYDDPNGYISYKKFI